MDTTATNGNGSIDNFQINVKALGRENSLDVANEECVLEYENISSAKEFCDFKNYNQEWREMADLIIKEVVPKNLGIRWNDCIGMGYSIEVMKEAVVYPIKYPQIFSGLVTPWRGW